MNALDEAQRLAMRGHSAEAVSRLERAGYTSEEPPCPGWAHDDHDRLLADPVADGDRVAESRGSALGIVLAVALDRVRRGDATRRASWAGRPLPLGGGSVRFGG